MILSEHPLLVCLGRKNETVPVQLCCGNKLALRHKLILTGYQLGVLLWVGISELRQQFLDRGQGDAGQL